MAPDITTEIAKAKKVAASAAALAARLEQHGEYSTRAMYDLFDLCNAVIELIDDGDCLSQRDTLMEELRCDEDGNPLWPEPSDLVRLPTGYALRIALNGSVMA